MFINLTTESLYYIMYVQYITYHDTCHVWNWIQLNRVIMTLVYVTSHLLCQIFCGRVQLKPDGTWWRVGGEVKRKLANGMGSQYSHAASEHGVSSITTADVHTSAASSRLNWRTRPILNGLVRFGERRNLVSARVPSHLKRSLLRAVIVLIVGHQTSEFMIITILKLTL